jgi:hypothetical protein
MFLFFPPSQREFNNTAAYASGVRERKKNLIRGWTTANMKGVEA